MLEVAIEIPELGSDPVQGFGVLDIEGQETLKDPFGVDPAKGMKEDVELTGTVTDDDQFLWESVFD